VKTGETLPDLRALREEPALSPEQVKYRKRIRKYLRSIHPHGYCNKHQERLMIRYQRFELGKTSAADRCFALIRISFFDFCVGVRKRRMGVARRNWQWQK